MASIVLAGQVAVVSGASSGIGAAIAQELSAAGMALVLTARRGERLQQVASSLSGRSAILDADMADPQTPARLLSLARDRFGRVDVVINNAGLIRAGTVETIDLEAVAQMIRVNFEAVVRMSYLFAREFKAQGSGAIVNVSSIGAYLISQRMGVYGALKHALEAFTASLRIELAGTGVKVGTVAPGSTQTEIFERMQPPAASDPLAQGTPLEPADVAAAVRFMLEQPPRANIARLALFAATDAH